MNGHLLYELAKQRDAERRAAARQAGLAREQREIQRELRAAERDRRRAGRRAAAALPAIPDFPAQLLAAARGAAPAECADGAGRTRPGR